MKRAKPRKKVSDQELLEIILSSTDQDNFEDTMPTYLLEAARGDRRLAARIAATLDHRATQECSDAEVAALVGELDDLERIVREFDAQ